MASVLIRDFENFSEANLEDNEDGIVCNSDETFFITAKQCKAFSRIVTDGHTEGRAKVVKFRRFTLFPISFANQQKTKVLDGKKSALLEMEKNVKKALPFFHIIANANSGEFDIDNLTCFDVQLISLKESSSHDNALYDVAKAPVSIKNLNDGVDKVAPWISPASSTTIFCTTHNYAHGDILGNFFDLAKKTLPGRNVFVAKTSAQMWTLLLDAAVAKFYTATTHPKQVLESPELISCHPMFVDKIERNFIKYSVEHEKNNNKNDDNAMSNDDDDDDDDDRAHNNKRRFVQTAIEETVETFVPRSWRTTPSVLVLGRNKHRGRRVTCVVLEGLVTRQMQFEVFAFPTNGCVLEFENPSVCAANDSEWEDHHQLFPLIPGTVFVATIVSGEFVPPGEDASRTAKRTSNRSAIKESRTSSNCIGPLSGGKLVGAFGPGSVLRALPWNHQVNKNLIWKQVQGGIERIEHLSQCANASETLLLEEPASTANATTTTTTATPSLEAFLASRILFAFPSNVRTFGHMQLELVFPDEKIHEEYLQLFITHLKSKSSNISGELLTGAAAVYSVHAVWENVPTDEDLEYYKTVVKKPFPIRLSLSSLDESDDPPAPVIFMGAIEKNNLSNNNNNNNRPRYNGAFLTCPRLISLDQNQDHDESEDTTAAATNEEISGFVSCDPVVCIRSPISSSPNKFAIDQNTKGEDVGLDEVTQSDVQKYFEQQQPIYQGVMFRINNLKQTLIGRVVNINSFESVIPEKFYFDPSESSESPKELVKKMFCPTTTIDRLNSTRHPSFSSKVLASNEVLQVAINNKCDDISDSLEMFYPTPTSINNNNNNIIQQETPRYLFNAMLREKRAETVMSNVHFSGSALQDQESFEEIPPIFLGRNLFTYDRFLDNVVLNNMGDADVSCAIVSKLVNAKHEYIFPSGGNDQQQRSARKSSRNRLLKLYRDRNLAATQANVFTSFAMGYARPKTIPSLLEWVLGCWIPPFPQDVSMSNCPVRAWQVLNKLHLVLEKDEEILRNDKINSSPSLPFYSHLHKLLFTIIRISIRSNYKTQVCGGIHDLVKIHPLAGGGREQLWYFGFVPQSVVVKNRGLVFEDTDSNLIEDENFEKQRNPQVASLENEIFPLRSIAEGAAKCGNVKLLAGISNFLCNLCCGSGDAHVNQSLPNYAPVENWGEKLNASCPKFLFPPDKPKDFAANKRASEVIPCVDAYSPSAPPAPPNVPVVKPPNHTAFNTVASSAPHNMKEFASMDMPLAYLIQFHLNWIQTQEIRKRRIAIENNNNNSSSSPVENIQQVDDDAAATTKNQEFVNCVSTVAMNQIRMHMVAHKEQGGIFWKMEVRRNAGGRLGNNGIIAMLAHWNSKTSKSVPVETERSANDRSLNLYQLLVHFQSRAAALTQDVPLSSAVLSWFLYQCMRGKLDKNMNDDKVEGGEVLLLNNAYSGLSIVRRVLSYLIA